MDASSLLSLSVTVFTAKIPAEKSALNKSLVEVGSYFVSTSGKIFFVTLSGLNEAFGYNVEESEESDDDEDDDDDDEDGGGGCGKEEDEENSCGKVEDEVNSCLGTVTPALESAMMDGEGDRVRLFVFEAAADVLKSETGSLIPIFDMLDVSRGVPTPPLLCWAIRSVPPSPSPLILDLKRLTEGEKRCPCCCCCCP